MPNIFHFLQQVLISVAVVVSAANPFATHIKPTPAPIPINIVIPTATPTPTPIPQQQVQGASTYSSQTNNNDPLVDCTGPDGKHLKITQKACDDFNRAWANTKSTNQTNNSNQQYAPGVRTSSEPFVTCVLSYGTYQISQSDCDYDKQRDVPISWPSLPTQYPTMTPYPTYDHQAAQQQCINQENQLYTGLVNDMHQKYGDGANTEGLYQPHLRNLATCNSY